MLNVNRYLLTLILWLSFLFNIERIDLSRSDAFNIATEVYVVAIAMTILGVVVPSYKRTSLWHLQIVAVLSLLVGWYVSQRPIWGGAFTYIALFELTAVLITMTLAYMVGRLSADFVDTVESLTFSDLDGRVSRASQAEAVFKREMQYSRRSGRPLTVVVVDAKTDGVRQNFQMAAQDVQRLLVKRHSLVALTRLAARTLRRTDVILDETPAGRLVLVMPEAREEQTSVVIERLRARVQQQLGVDLRYSTATFPDQGVTFDELVHQAERNLQTQGSERRGELEAGSPLDTVSIFTAVERVPEPTAETVSSVSD